MPVLCAVCRNGLQGIWDPSKTQRLGLRSSVDTESTEHSFFIHFYKNQVTDQATWLEAEQDLPEVERFIYGHHASKESLEQSRREGCIACCGVADESAEIVERFGYSTAFGVEFMHQNGETQFQMVICFGDDLVNTVSFAPYPPRTQLFHSSLTNSTEDSATWDVVEWWLSSCVTTHEACAVTSQSDWVPTRLLKLDVANNTFRLVSHNDVEPESRYAALSHCWGSKSWSSHLILNSDNDASLRKAQPVTILPKTFRNALTVVQRLNLQYLWIDRFCIYQDSKEDWQKEASTMHNVYRNSFICISALSAADDEGGCFFTRDFETIRPTIINLSEDGVCRPMMCTSHRNNNYAWQDVFTQEVLTTRAWVFQERLLAPRTLHLGKDQVYWECNQEIRSESHPEHEWRRPEHEWRRANTALHRYFKELTEPLIAWKALIGRNTPDYQAQESALGDQWVEILSFYSNCELSHGQDKLVAVSAIVKDMKRHFENLGKPSDYFAGIWGLWLPMSLLWSVAPGTAQERRPQQYRAPSWSWAAVDSPVFSQDNGWLCKNEGQVASVTCVEITHLTDDDTGLVAGGTLTMRGMLVRVLLEKSTSWDTRFPTEGWQPKGFETVHGDPIEYTLEEGLHRCDGPYPSIYFDTEEDVSERVLFLPIHVTVQPDSTGIYRGLILATSGSEHRRIGYMDIHLCWILKEVEEYQMRIV